MEGLEKVNNYLNDAGVFYFTTVDGDKPKCRPFSFHMIENGRIYFGLGNHKEVYKQLQENPNVEIVAMAKGTFLRYYGKIVFDLDESLSEKALDTMPNLRAIYNNETGKKLAMCYLENATAEFRNAVSIIEKIEL